MKKLLILFSMSVTLTCGAVALTACSGAAEYSITCDACENGAVIVADTSVKAGEKVILAAHPAAGYRLTAFYLDGEAMEGVSFVMPEKDVTVSAQFELVTYSVTYVLGDAAFAGSNPETYTVKNAVELIEPEKEGYEICGWYTYFTEPENEWETIEWEDYRVTSLEGLFGNLTLFAKYYNPLHEITNTGSENGWYYVESGFGQASFGETISVAVEPNTGYELDYLAVNGEPIEGTTFCMPACDVELSAVFKPIRYAITYELDGGENSPYNPAYYTVEDGEYGYVTIHDAYKEGYLFMGWYYYEDDYEQYLWDSSIGTYLCRPVTLYARFIVDDEE